MLRQLTVREVRSRTFHAQDATLHPYISNTSLNKPKEKITQPKIYSKIIGRERNEIVRSILPAYWGQFRDANHRSDTAMDELKN